MFCQNSCKKIDSDFVLECLSVKHLISHVVHTCDGCSSLVYVVAILSDHNSKI